MDALFQLPLIAILDQAQGKIRRLPLLLSLERIGGLLAFTKTAALPGQRGFQQGTAVENRGSLGRYVAACADSDKLADGDDRVGVAGRLDDFIKAIMRDDGQGIDRLNARPDP